MFKTNISGNNKFGGHKNVEIAAPEFPT